MKYLIALSILMSLALTACQQKSVRSGGTIAKDMQGLKGSFLTLLPDIYSRRNFHQLDRAKRIEKNIEIMAQQTHKVSTDAVNKLPSGDPGLSFVANRLDLELKVALESFRSGNKEYSRRTLKNISKNCFFCHSQTNMGPQFTVDEVIINSKELLKTEKADLFVATRNYDKALGELENAVTSTKYVQNYPFEQERALRKYLAISTRVKKQPQEALGLFNRLLNSKIRPAYLQDYVLAWRDSLARWKREFKRSQRSANKSPLKEAQRLVKQAQVLQEYPIDNSGDVYYLRATNIMHDYLQKSPKTKNRSNALYLLANSYEVLSDIGLWDLSDIYYEACIREKPHSKESLRCYKRWEQSMFMGYSGSGGVYIPSTIRGRMNELKKIANP